MGGRKRNKREEGVEGGVGVGGVCGGGMVLGVVVELVVFVVVEVMGLSILLPFTMHMYIKLQQTLQFSKPVVIWQLWGSSGVSLVKYARQKPSHDHNVDLTVHVYSSHGLSMLLLKNMSCYMYHM